MKWIESLRKSVEKHPVVWLAITLFTFVTLGWGLREGFIKMLTPKEPIASFKYDIGEDGLVTFENLSENYKSIQWDYGDGTFGGIQDTAHQFEVNGTYNITLTVSNEAGSHTNITSVNIENVALGQRVFYAADVDPSDLPIYLEINGVSKGTLTKSFDMPPVDCYNLGTQTISLPAGVYEFRAVPSNNKYGGQWQGKVEFTKGTCQPFRLDG